MSRLLRLAASLILSLPAAAQLIPAAARQPAPAFHLQTSTGQPLTNTSLHGRVVLLDFWATTCGGCKIEIPWYIEDVHRFAPQGLTAVGVATDDDWSIVRPWLAQHPIPYTITLGSEPLEAAYKVQTLPMTLLLDRRGRIAATHTGMVDRDSFAHEIQLLLAE